MPTTQDGGEQRGEDRDAFPEGGRQARADWRDHAVRGPACLSHSVYAVQRHDDTQTLPGTVEHLKLLESVAPMKSDSARSKFAPCAREHPSVHRSSVLLGAANGQAKMSPSTTYRCIHFDLAVHGL